MFLDSPFGSLHLTALTTGGSGAGVCTCGVDSNGPSNVIVTGAGDR